MENITNWSAEEYYGSKIEMHVNSSLSSCWTGTAAGNLAYLQLYYNLTNPNMCIRPYYVNGVPRLDNPGELGNQWIYMTGPLHESLHTISPTPINLKPWMREGWSQYLMYNTLSNYDGNGFTDINQETADTYLYREDSSMNWPSYVANDYRDQSNYPIQDSQGYDITAWMFSMMRDNHSLNWNSLYKLISDNEETSNKAYQRVLASGNIYSPDMFIIDLFGRASDLDFETQTKPIWRYDGPSGPGWGVRNWEALDWYADLSVPYLNFSDSNGGVFYMGENVTINANISNTGQVDLQGVVVKIYEGTNLLKEQIININAGAIVPISANFYSPTANSYNIRVVVDENSIKIETNDANNENTKVLSFQSAKCGDTDNSGAIDVLDVVNMVNVAFRGQPQGNNPAWVWNVNGDTSGAIDIIDVVKIVNVAFRGANAETELTCQPVSNVQASTTITIQKTSTGFSASANLDRNVAGMQFDLTYNPSKISIVKIIPSTRTSEMTFINTPISYGKNRITVYSSNGGKFIKYGTGTLFTIQASGSDFSSLKVIPTVVDYKTSNKFSNVKVNLNLKTTAKTAALQPV